MNKTLRFALKPQGKTGDFIRKNNLLKQDECRAAQYRKAKRIIDLYHKDFIEKALKGVAFCITDLEELQGYRQNNNRGVDESQKKLQKKLRKQIAQQIKETKGYENLFKKELITEILPAWLEENQGAKSEALPDIDSEEYPDIIAEFKKWTTYFAGFYENRKNMYSKEAKATAIAFRIVHENLPKFLDNCARWHQLECEFKDIFQSFKSEISDLEKAADVELRQVFQIEFFNRCLNQSGIDHFNLILGGRSNEKGQKLQGLNEIINLHRQKLSSSEDKEKGKKLGRCKMALLYKQILSDRESYSFLPEQFENDAELMNAINEYFKKIDENISDEKRADNVCSSLKSCLERLGSDEVDLKKVYIENKSLRNLSKALYGDWGAIERTLEAHAETLFPAKNPEQPTKGVQNQRKNYIEKTGRFSIAELQTVIDKHGDTETQNLIVDYFKNKHSGLITEIKNKRRDAEDILQGEYSDEEKTLNQKKEKVAKIKQCLDSVQDFLHLIRPLYVNLKSDKEASAAPEKDATFYHDFDLCYERLRLIVPLYNKARNYLTRKPYKTEKYKLNFENSTLLGGWDVNKEKDNTSIILRKGNKYYLGIMNKDDNQVFQYSQEEENKEKLIKLKEQLEKKQGELITKKQRTKVYQKLINEIMKLEKKLSDIERILPKANEAKYEKMLYKQIADAKKEIQNLICINGKTVRKIGQKDETGVNSKLEEIKNKYLPEQINLIRKKESYLKSNDSFEKTDLTKYINYYIERLEYFDFNFVTKKPKEYSDFKNFTDHIASQGYKINFNPISEKYINLLVEEGRLFLFQIYNKDFSEKSKGRPNLHTIYWRALFDPENLKDVVVKLNGEAEMFFRAASIKYTDKQWKQGHHAEKLKGKFNYPIIKNRRYARDTYLFHVPITINFKRPSLPKDAARVFNSEVNAFLQNNPNIHILSIDRGERHLAYYTLLDQKGAILKQGSLNKVCVEGENGGRTVDYQKKLHEREGARDEARKSWKKIESIKELKEGYLSQIVHKIAVMMVRYNAIVVFEDLNFGFKRGRFKFEKQVYQKLEKMLIDKLNYLVFKDTEARQPGGALCGYQLSAPFESFKAMGKHKQTGFIYYVPAHYTSKICPATGFVNRLYPKYKNKEDAIRFFSTFEAISYNTQEDYFEFTFLYSRFAEKKFIKTIEGMRDKWTVCTCGARFRNSKDGNGKWTTEEVHLTTKMKSLLENNGIKYQDGQDLRSIIEQKEAGFFKELFDLLRLTLQLRNSRVGTDNESDNTNDYILSCVKDAQGVFFDSRRASEDMPQNADANGAFHIGLKGLWMLRQIHGWQGDWQDKKSPKLAIPNEDWYRFVQDQEYKNSGF